MKRHDIITGSSTEIIKTPDTRVVEAQVSADGQWVLYDAIIAGQDELRLIRVDGQNAQTLLCAPAGQSIFSAQWSTNEQYVIFDQGAPTGVPTAFLLDLINGSLQKELIPAGNQGYMPRTWLDRSHVVLTGFVPNSAATQQGLYLLNINNGANQSDSSLQRIANTTSCWSFDTGKCSSALRAAVIHPSSLTYQMVQHCNSLDGQPCNLIRLSPMLPLRDLADT